MSCALQPEAEGASLICKPAKLEEESPAEHVKAYMNDQNILQLSSNQDTLGFTTNGFTTEAQNRDLSTGTHTRNCVART